MSTGDIYMTHSPAPSTPGGNSNLADAQSKTTDLQTAIDALTHVTKASHETFLGIPYTNITRMRRELSGLISEHPSGPDFETKLDEFTKKWETQLQPKFYNSHEKSRNYLNETIRPLIHNIRVANVLAMKDIIPLDESTLHSNEQELENTSRAIQNEVYKLLNDTLPFGETKQVPGHVVNAEIFNEDLNQLKINISKFETDLGLEPNNLYLSQRLENIKNTLNDFITKSAYPTPPAATSIPTNELSMLDKLKELETRLNHWKTTLEVIPSREAFPHELIKLIEQKLDKLENENKIKAKQDTFSERHAVIKKKKQKKKSSWW